MCCYTQYEINESNGSCILSDIISDTQHIVQLWIVQDFIENENILHFTSWVWKLYGNIIINLKHHILV